MGLVASHTRTTRTGLAICVRNVDEADAPALLALSEHILQTAGEFGVRTEADTPPTLDEERTWITKNNDDPGKVAIVAVDPTLDPQSSATGSIIGLVNFGAHKHIRMRHNGLLGISVHQLYRNKGVGRVLLETLVDWARTQPTLEKLTLCVFEHNARAIHLYESIGFRQECVRKGEFKFGPGHYVNDIQMGLWLWSDGARSFKDPQL